MQSRTRQPHSISHQTRLMQLSDYLQQSRLTAELVQTSRSLEVDFAAQAYKPDANVHLPRESSVMHPITAVLFLRPSVEQLLLQHYGAPTDFHPATLSQRPVLAQYSNSKILKSLALHDFAQEHLCRLRRPITAVK